MKLANCIIKDTNGKILLLHRNTPKRVQWEIPNGKVNLGEKPEHAAKRELKEELDVSVEVIRQIGIKDFAQDGKRYKYYWYEAKVSSGKYQLLEPHIHDDFRHFSLKDMKELFEELSVNTKNFLASNNLSLKTPPAI